MSSLVYEISTINIVILFNNDHSGNELVIQVHSSEIIDCRISVTRASVPFKSYVMW